MVSAKRASRLHGRPANATSAPWALSCFKTAHYPSRCLQPNPPPLLRISEAVVAFAARWTSRDTAIGPDRTPSRWIHLLVKPRISTEAGATVLSFLNKLVNRIATGGQPDPVQHLFAAATLLTFQTRLGKIRPIAFCSTPLPIVARDLPPTAIDDSTDFLSSYQLAVGIKAGVDAMVHDTPALLQKVSQTSNVASILVYARNACNRVNSENGLHERYSQSRRPRKELLRAPKRRHRH